MFDFGKTIVLGAALVFASTAADAAVTISSDPTSNMSCSNGVCAPTATDAVLNTNDLQTTLASGSLSVLTTNGSVQANDIAVTATFSWTTANTITLDAFHSIMVTATVKDDGAGGLSLVTNDGGSGGTLSFLGPGSIRFKNIRDVLSINGTRYKLAKSIKSLAHAIVADPNGAFALAVDYDAKPDGVYRSIPIPVNFGGQFNGLGHSISRLEIGDTADSYVGFFWALNNTGTVSSFGLKNVIVEAANSYYTGGLVGRMDGGTINNSWTSGTVNGGYGSATGGLVGYENSGSFINSWSSAQVINLNEIGVGGLVGEAYGGTISDSFATGSVSNYLCVGGLVGSASFATIANSYATGPDSGTYNAYDTVGGLVGCAENVSIGSTYSTGLVTGATGALVGGFIGSNSNSNGNSTATSCYWDTTTSGTSLGVGGGDPISGEITGETTAQLQSGLPAGFNPSIWAENPKINNGFPYLIANPPPQ